MKRLLSLFLTLLLLLSFALSFSAEIAEDEFYYFDAITEMTSGRVSDPVFCGGRWQLVYRSPEKGTFLTIPGWKTLPEASQPVFYAVSPEQRENPASPYFYCMVREGVAFYPGVNVPVGISFLCPKDGTVRLVAFGYFSDVINSKNAAGNRVSVYQDGALIWDRPAVEYSANVEIDLSVEVKAGQRLTLAFGENGFSAGNAFCISGAPTVQYTTVSSDAAVLPPETVNVGEITESSVTVLWEPVPGVSGYKVLCDGVQVSPGVAYTDTSFHLSGLAPDTEYSVSVVSLSPEGVLSASGTAVTIRTLKPASDPGASDSVKTDQSAGSSETSGGPSVKTLLLWVCIAGGVLLLGIGAGIAVLLFRRKR